MMKKLRDAISLLRVSWRLLMLDKELVVFPILSLLVLLSLLGAIVGPIYASGQLIPWFDTIADRASNPYDPAVLAIGFSIYFVAFFVVVFFNAALIACVKIRLSGGDPVVMDGLKSSIKKLPQIFMWTLFAATVGFILDQISQRSKGIARFLIGFVGAAWAIAVFFAVPVLVSENVSPIGALKRSAAIVKSKWGEALFAQFGLSILYALVLFGAVACFIVGGIVSEFIPAIGMAIWVGAGVIVAATFFVFPTLDSILKAALYVYATDGKLPPSVSTNLFEKAFTDQDPKNS